MTFEINALQRVKRQIQRSCGRRIGKWVVVVVVVVVVEVHLAGVDGMSGRLLEEFDGDRGGKQQRAAADGGGEH